MQIIRRPPSNIVNQGYILLRYGITYEWESNLCLLCNIDKPKARYTQDLEATGLRVYVSAYLVRKAWALINS